MKLMHFYKLQKKNGRLMGQSHELDFFEDLWNNEIYTSYTFFLIFEMFLLQATYSTVAWNYVPAYSVLKPNGVFLCTFFITSSSSTLSEDTGIEPRTVATGALAVRRSNH